MLGKLIGAIVGERLAQNVSGVNGTGGVLLWTAAATIIRLGPVDLINEEAGGEVLKKYCETKYAQTPDLLA